jgi:hypothetical protein
LILPLNFLFGHFFLKPFLENLGCDVTRVIILEIQSSLFLFEEYKLSELEIESLNLGVNLAVQLLRVASLYHPYKVNIILNAQFQALYLNLNFLRFYNGEV